MEMIGERFELQCQIGEGCWSTVVKALDTRSMNSVAIKLEAGTEPERSLLLREGKILKLLQGISGIPELYDKGSTTEHNYLVVELLEMNFEELYRSKKLTPMDVMLKAEQLITIFENVHKKCIVHQDVKPKNLMVKGLQSFLIDFGLASTIKHGRKNTPRTRGVIGTPSFASLAALLGMTQYAKDDIEALGYCIIWLLRGSLPWEAYVTDFNLSGLKTMKFHSSVRQICQDCPDEMMHYFNYIKGLKEIDQPDYEFLRGLMVCSQRKISFDRNSSVPKSPRVEKYQQPRQRIKSEDITISHSDSNLMNQPYVISTATRGKRRSSHDFKERKPPKPEKVSLSEKSMGSTSICSILEFNKVLCLEANSSIEELSNIESSPKLKKEKQTFSAAPETPKLTGKLEEARRTSKRLVTILELKDLIAAESKESSSENESEISQNEDSPEPETANQDIVLITETIEELPSLSPNTKKQLKQIKTELSPIKRKCSVF